MNSISSLVNKDNILVLSNGCGAGHISTEKYISGKLREQNSKVNAISIDTIKCICGDTIGQWILDYWVQKQKDGEIVTLLNGCLDFQWADRYLLSVFAFVAFLYKILKEDIDAVVTVQPLATGALLVAVRVANFIYWFFGSKKEPIKVTMVLTELPTQYTENFFYYLRHLSEGDRSIFKLVTAHPLLENGESEADFWQRTCALPLENIEYVTPEELPVRPAFKKQYETEGPVHLKLKVAMDQLAAIQRCAGLPFELNGEEITVPVLPTDEVASIRLGGQACLETAKSYTSTLMDRARRQGQRQFIFVFCGNEKGENSLFQHICKLVDEKRHQAGYEDVHVVPLAFQDDTHIAPLVCRSDHDFIKTGGATAMEMLALHRNRPKGKILIHAAPLTGSSAIDDEELMTQGMPMWEAGNARYLKERLGAEIFSPHTFDFWYGPSEDASEVV